MLKSNQSSSEVVIETEFSVVGDSTSIKNPVQIEAVNNDKVSNGSKTGELPANPKDVDKRNDNGALAKGEENAVSTDTDFTFSLNNEFIVLNVSKI